MKKSLVKTVVLVIIMFVVSINISCSQSEIDNGNTIDKVKKQKK